MEIVATFDGSTTRDQRSTLIHLKMLFTFDIDVLGSSCMRVASLASVHSSVEKTD